MKGQYRNFGIILGVIFSLSVAAGIAQSEFAARAVQVGEIPQWPTYSPRHQAGRGAMDYDRQTLEKYAAVALDQARIEEELAHRLQNVQEEEQAIMMQEEATRGRISAIREQDLDLRTYNEITHLIKTDRKLGAEIEQICKGAGDPLNAGRRTAAWHSMVLAIAN